ncbi:hypothetical protein NDU88_012839 [Pleurodeles waltl]|uniref:Uncharacterized protein n=1 Tax=Pleurodeles waltl TaxID=8319 RepID=A0AAV7R2M9_PLEWA|nr:hypothetical protein NDU88_012839 [Pleurodeles waltl]
MTAVARRQAVRGEGYGGRGGSEHLGARRSGAQQPGQFRQRWMNEGKLRRNLNLQLRSRLQNQQVSLG